MKDYRSYMDRVTVSRQLHDKLLGLEAGQKRRGPLPWKKYAAAACAALLLGAGVWGVSQHEKWMDMTATFHPYAVVTDGPGPVPSAQPSPPSESQGTAEIVDIAPEDPEAGVGAGMKTIVGYETQENRAGLEVSVYHVLPWIDYGAESSAAATAMDWDIPQGAVRRELSGGEIIALLGGADAVDVHLDWSAYELTGWAAWYGDGSFWGAYLGGYQGPMDHFEFAVTAGQLPPTCIQLESSVEQEVWGMTLVADKFDGKEGCTRRVSFMKDGYGYRFDLTATGAAEDAEKLVSRAVTWVANGEGLDLSLAASQETDPSEQEPNWDGGGDSSPPSPPPSWDGQDAPSVPPQDGQDAPSVPPQDGQDAPSVPPQDGQSAPSVPPQESRSVPAPSLSGGPDTD